MKYEVSEQIRQILALEAQAQGRANEIWVHLREAAKLSDEIRREHGDRFVCGRQAWGYQNLNVGDAIGIFGTHYFLKPWVGVAVLGGDE